MTKWFCLQDFKTDKNYIQKIWWREIVLEDRICVILHFDLVNQLWIFLEEATISPVKNSPETGSEHN